MLVSFLSRCWWVWSLVVEGVWLSVVVGAHGSSLWIVAVSSERDFISKQYSFSPLVNTSCFRAMPSPWTPQSATAELAVGACVDNSSPAVWRYSHLWPLPWLEVPARCSCLVAHRWQPSARQWCLVSTLSPSIWNKQKKNNSTLLRVLIHPLPKHSCWKSTNHHTQYYIHNATHISISFCNIIFYTITVFFTHLDTWRWLCVSLSAGTQYTSAITIYNTILQTFTMQLVCYLCISGEPRAEGGRDRQTAPP